jgi:hypothetical protein
MSLECDSATPECDFHWVLLLPLGFCIIYPRMPELVPHDEKNYTINNILQIQVGQPMAVHTLEYL